WFLPTEEDDELNLAYFTFQEPYADGKKVGNSEIGDIYHIAFFKKDEEGQPIFDDAFEAILGDPKTYVNNLRGAGLYGCIVRKTDKSVNWFDNYLKDVLGRVMINKLSMYASSIANSK
ncbi:MAG: hypothetical protein ORN50_00375, partial [Crocinitomicaceae bacterium]|nr:hypothetical protein [Crocinitomicaceae bacterium]